MQYKPPAVNKKHTASQPLDVQLQPPFSLEAEQALLGAIFLKNDALDSVIDFLEPAHFFDALHAEIYRVVIDLISAGTRVTPITLKPFFEHAPSIDGEMTAVGYLGRLAARAPSTTNAVAYGRVIRDCATRRSLILIGEDIAAAAHEAHNDFPPNEQIEEAETRLFALVERGEKGQETDLASAMHMAVEHAHAAHTGKKTGLATGLVDLDALLGGLQPTDLIVLAGRPSMGKSALATNIARFIASESVDKHGVIERGTPVGFFSLEMSREQIAMRILGECMRLASDRIRKGKLSQEEFSKLKQEAPTIGGLPILIDDTGGLSIAQLSSRARRMKRKHKIGLLIVDYLQLMHAGRKTENRVQDVSAITAGLKALAKELHIPVLALSQLSRQVEGRDNKRPQLSDLRESGSIEQDADVVMFIYREEYYLERAKPPLSETDKYADWNAKLMSAAGKAEAVIGKQRHGGSGIVELAFSKELMLFSSLAKQVGEARA